MKSYLGELRSEWRPLSAAVIGLSGGLILISYVVGIMGPYLLDEFGWSKSEFALISALGLGAVFVFPFVGRITDRIGVRKTALVGIVAAPLIYIALSAITSMWSYAALFALQATVLVTTTSPVYCRVIVQYFQRARGLALSISGSGPALVVVVGGPLLNNFVADHGWRSGYISLAIFTAVCGLLTLLLLPPENREAVERKSRPATEKHELKQVFRSSAFWILFASVLVCNLPQAMITANLSLVLAENGAVGKSASLLISAYAGGMLVGRLLSGISLDHLPPRMVSMLVTALSGVGLLVIASGYDSRPVLFVALLVFGFSLGAEGDLVAFLIVRTFGLRIYSSVHGLLAATVAISAVLGAGILSLMLNYFGLYAPFLVLAGLLSIVGGLMFLFLPHETIVEDGSQMTRP